MEAGSSITYGTTELKVLSKAIEEEIVRGVDYN